MDSVEHPNTEALSIDGEADASLELSQAAPAASTEAIGRVDTLEGTVEATSASGTKVTLSQGDSIFQGDVIETGGNASVSLVMADDTVFSLDADGEVTMDEMVYDPVAQSGKISATLVKGVSIS